MSARYTVNDGPLVGGELWAYCIIDEFNGRLICQCNYHPADTARQTEAEANAKLIVDALNLRASP